ncbi:ATP-dependent nuclease [Pseudomonas aeruginosa]|uniref:ATP-dependent nuclease n=1 Tax=Pseudomonas aeruginosa TaxID=287 RepID=UPI0012477928|nr:AAA family ATPase [Pseudomonas aeruginosa]KAB0690308.1 AAA family ATPase [Pseudomonas aeruginosa]
MQHYIQRLIISNFKSCQSLNITLTPFVPLVGYNNAGKSNILSALEWVLKNRLLNDSEFYNRSKPIEVEAVIVGISDEILKLLGEDHRNKIEPYIVDGTMKVKRIQPIEATKATDVQLHVFHPETGYKKNPTGIPNAIKQLFPDPIRIAAMDNAADDAAKAKSTSTIGKLLAEFCDAVREKNALRIDRHLGAITRRMSADGNRRLTELSEIDESINKKIQDLFPGISLKLHFDVPTFDEIFKAGTVRVYEESSEISRDFSAYGHGAQRSIQMALVRHLAEVRKEANVPTTTLLLIDEPELYLHPFAIEQVREALHTLSMHGYQIVFSTHSPQMITAERAQHTLLVRKTNTDGTITRKRMKDALDIVIPNAIAQAQHLFSLTQSSQILFSNRVILTEGKTELRLLPFLYKSFFGKTLGQDQLAMIETGSVDSIAKTLRALKEMDIPAVAVVDLDYGFRGAIANGFLQERSEEIVELKKILARLEQAGKCKLHGGLPTSKLAPCTAAQAFELLALEADAVPHLKALHNALRIQNIWLWWGGAIEAHLGLTDKEEATWVKFKTDIEIDGIRAHCKDAQSIEDLLTWFKEG